MSIHIANDDLGIMLITMFAILIFFTIAACIAYAAIRNGDNKKPLITCNVRVIEKLSSQGKIAWYILETENGERLQLRTFKANILMLSKGDNGKVTYQGKTITDFKRI